jgi:hypothetical protein
MFSSQYVLDKNNFQKNINVYKQDKEKDPFNSSKKMMSQTIKDLPDNIHQYMNSFIKNLDLDLILRNDAINSLIDNSKKGKIIFSTTNYEDLAILFINQIIKEYNIENITKISGSTINWKEKEILHFNCGPLKLNCLKNIDIIEKSYGDDPYYNDRDLINCAKKGYIITNKKNKEFKTNNRLNWK